MPKKKIQKKSEKKIVKKAKQEVLPKKTIKKKSLIKRIDDNNPEQLDAEIAKQISQQDKVKTEIIITDGIVIVNPVFNPFDLNNKD